jgi:hypothetical protein
LIHQSKAAECRGWRGYARAASLIFVAPTDGNPSLPRSSPAATARLTENFDIFAETLGHNVKSALFGEIRL